MDWMDFEMILTSARFKDRKTQVPKRFLCDLAVSLY